MSSPRLRAAFDRLIGPARAAAWPRTDGRWPIAAMAFIAGAAMGEALASAGLLIGATLTLIGLAVAAGRGRVGASTALLVAALAGGALTGAAGPRWAETTPPPPAPPWAGRVERVTLRGVGARAVVTPDAAPGWRAEVAVDALPPGLAPDARIMVFGALRPLLPADQPGGYDAQRRGRAEHIAWRGRGPIAVQTPAADGLLATRLAIRQRLDRLDRPFGAGVLAGLLLGDRAAVPPAARDALQQTGTGHLLAVSGLHVGGLAGLLALLTLALARRLGAVHPHRPAAVIALVSALAYAALAQFPVGGLRAALMVALIAGGRLLGRRVGGLDVLALAAIGVLATAPERAGEAGFQLSFGAVAALLVFAGLDRGLRGAALAAVAAAAATAPVQAWHFGTFAPLAPLANLVLCPLVSLGLVPLGLLGLALAPLTELPLALAARGAELFVALAEVMADAGGEQIVGRAVAPALAIPLVALLGLRFRAPRLAALAAAGLTLASALLWPRGVTADFIAVGQGDAVLLRAGGEAMLVDTGPDPRAFVLLGALRRAGVRRLARVVITHGHPDHFGGLAAVATALPIGEVRFNGRHPAGQAWRRARHVLRRAGVPLRPAQIEDWPLGEATVSVLLAEAPRAAAENDASIALRVRGPAADLLLTGDLEKAGEARLVATGLQPATVLKAAHHGSRTSTGSALLAATCPQAVIIPAGRDNRFGFPHAEVLRALAARGLDPWQTDRDGGVRVHLDAPPRIVAAHRAAEGPLASRRELMGGCRDAR